MGRRQKIVLFQAKYCVSRTFRLNPLTDRVAGNVIIWRATWAASIHANVHDCSYHFEPITRSLVWLSPPATKPCPVVWYFQLSFFKSSWKTWNQILGCNFDCFFQTSLMKNEASCSRWSEHAKKICVSHNQWVALVSPVLNPSVFYTMQAQGFFRIATLLFSKSLT